MYPTTAEVLGFQDNPTLCWVVAFPDPVNASTVGVFAALLAREMVPDAAPLDSGVKVRVKETLWPAEIVWGSDIPARLNSGLVVVADEIVTLDPAADRVAVKVFLLPRVTVPKLNVAALAVNWPANPPVPERAIEWEGLAQAFDFTVIWPVCFPLVPGLKATTKVTLWPGGKLIGRLNPLRLNPEPLTIALEIVTVEIR